MIQATGRRALRQVLVYGAWIAGTSLVFAAFPVLFDVPPDGSPVATGALGALIAGMASAAHALTAAAHFVLFRRPFRIRWPTTGNAIPTTADGLREWLFTAVFLALCVLGVVAVLAWHGGPG